MKVAVLYSGGKDSTYTLWIAQQQWEVVALITVLSGEESYLYQYQRAEIATVMAEAVGLPLKIVTITDKDEVDELGPVITVLEKLKVQALCIGGLLSEFQRMKFNNIAQAVNIPCFAPIWRKDQTLLLQDIERYFTVIFTTVAAMGFTQQDIGQVLDQKMLAHVQQLSSKFGVSIGGEGGEYETMVLDAPFYKKKIVLDEVEIHWDDTKYFGTLHIRKLHLEDK